MKIATLVIAILVLAVLETCYFLMLKGKWYYPSFLVSLIAIYIGIIVFASFQLQPRREESSTQPQSQPSSPLPDSRIGETKSPMLGLDDAKRFQLAKALRDATVNNNGPIACIARVHGKPKSDWSAKLWPEIQPLLFYAGWHVEGGRTAKSYFPSGVEINVKRPQGDLFTIAVFVSPNG